MLMPMAFICDILILFFFFRGEGRTSLIYGIQNHKIKVQNYKINIQVYKINISEILGK